MEKGRFIHPTYSRPQLQDKAKPKQRDHPRLCSTVVLTLYCPVSPLDDLARNWLQAEHTGVGKTGKFYGFVYTKTVFDLLV